MTIMLIDNPVDTATLTASSAAALLPAANIQDKARSKFWRSAAGTKSSLDVTFGTEAARTHAAFVDLNLTTGGTIRLQSWGAGLDKYTLKSKEGITLTYARNDTVGSFIDKSIQRKIAGIDAPRFDYNPATSTLKGLLAEPLRANKIKYANDLTNAAWVVGSGSVTVTGNDRTGYDGLTMDKVVFNATANANLLQDTLATPVNTQPWMVSFDVYSAAATTLNVQLLSTPGSQWSSEPTIAIPAGLSRVRLPAAAVVSGITTDTGIRMYFVTRDSVARTLWIGSVQLEQATTATTPIGTTTVAVTRQADVLSVLSSAIAGMLAAEHSVYVEFYRSASSGSGVENDPFAVGSTGLQCFIDGSTNALLVKNRADNLQVSLGTINFGTINRVVAFNKVGENYGGSMNGAGVSTGTQTATPTLGTVSIGANAGTNFLDGWIAKFRIYPTRLSNADAATLSGGGTITATPILDVDFTTLPGADFTITPTLYATAVAANNYGGDAYGNGNFGASAPASQLDARNITIYPFGASYADRYWRITFEDANTSYQQLARLYLTTPVEFTYNLSWGWKMSRDDRSAKRESLGGQRFVQERDSRLRISGDFDYLTEAERTAMAIRLFDLGDIDPIIFSVYPEATQRGLTTTGYGHLEDTSLSHKNYLNNAFPFTFVEDL